ncbi:hypothetical protein JL722_8871 [Aureococcus anophagefferens]|nr:hypothetical protein JL722_8871 [Aureococcus anophagefferens]
MASLESIFAALETEYRHDASPGERRCAREALAAVKADAGSCFGVARATLALPPGNDAVAFFGLGCLERVATTFWNGSAAKSRGDAAFAGRDGGRRGAALNASAPRRRRVFGVADSARGPAGEAALVAALRCLRHFATWVSWDGPHMAAARAAGDPVDFAATVAARPPAGDGAANVAALHAPLAPPGALGSALRCAGDCFKELCALQGAGRPRRRRRRRRPPRRRRRRARAHHALLGLLAREPPGPELLLPAFREAAKLAQARKVGARTRAAVHAAAPRCFDAYAASRRCAGADGGGGGGGDDAEAYDAEFVDADEYAQHFANMRAGLAQLVAALAELDAAALARRGRAARVAPHALALQFDALRDGAARVIASRALCDVGAQHVCEALVLASNAVRGDAEKRRSLLEAVVASPLADLASPAVAAAVATPRDLLGALGVLVAGPAAGPAAGRTRAADADGPFCSPACDALRRALGLLLARARARAAAARRALRRAAAPPGGLAALAAGDAARPCSRGV